MTIEVRHTSIVLDNYDMGASKKLENKLSIWDGFKYVPIGYVYDEANRKLLLPRGFSINFLESEFPKRTVVMNKDYDDFSEAYFKMKYRPKDKVQLKGLEFILGREEFKFNKQYSQSALTLNTGDGKTYCGIGMAAVLKRKFAVITYKNSLMDQWVKNALQFTDLTESDICVVRGQAIIKKLLKKDNHKFKMYVISHRSISSYGNNHGWDQITELFQNLKIGIKIYDEAHKELSNMLHIDAYTNTHNTVYMTSTFSRSDHNEATVFRTIFKNVPEFGKKYSMEEKERHITTILMEYDSHPTSFDKANCKTYKGFSATKFSDYIWTDQSNKELLYGIIKGFLDHIIFNREKSSGGKVAIIMSKNDHIDILEQLLKEDYPDKSIGKFNSRNKNKSDALDCEVILTTIRSMDAGDDIPNLRYVIMTEPYSSVVIADQLPGRLRDIGTKYNYSNVIYFEILDFGFDAIKRQYDKHKKVLRAKSKRFLYHKHIAK